MFMTLPLMLADVGKPKCNGVIERFM